MSVPCLHLFSACFGRIGTALLAALAVCILPVGTAHAQFLFGPQYSSSWGNQVSFGHKHGHGNYHSVQPPHGNGNYRFVQAPARARQPPFRSGTSTNRGTAITVSFRPPHGNGNYRFVQAPTRARLPFRSGTSTNRGTAISFRSGTSTNRSTAISFRSGTSINTSTQNLNWRRS